jgi:hypothetical protein
MDPITIHTMLADFQAATAAELLDKPVVKMAVFNERGMNEWRYFNAENDHDIDVTAWIKDKRTAQWVIEWFRKEWGAASEPHAIGHNCLQFVATGLSTRIWKIWV